MRISQASMPCLRRLFAVLAAFCLVVWGAAAGATPPVTGTGGVPSGTVDNRQSEMGIGEWLTRMHEASRKRAYVGTFVVSTGSTMTSARIWHICDGVQQMERVEPLSGAPRSTFRRNDQVITFLPETRTVFVERREALGLFPQLLTAPDSAIAQHYTARLIGSERVAGHDAEVVMLLPKDGFRFGYRIWNERKSGLVVKLQTLDTDGKVIEQVAFSELQMNAPVSMAKLTQMMNNTEGYRIERLEVEKTTASAEGWALRNPVAGFKSMSCHKRPGNPQDPAASDKILQWVFSDGLASVSLFVENFDRRRHVAEGVSSVGATHTLTRKFTDKAGEWWLTVVGEAPLQTLNVFAQGLERSR